jgi:hypothetical protein
MRQSPYRDMEILRPLTFTEALSALQAILTREVKVEVNHQTSFLGCGFEGTLELVQTLPPDHSSIRIVLSDRSSLFLDPAETLVFACGEPSPSSACLEFRCGTCTVATLETA